MSKELYEKRFANIFFSRPCNLTKTLEELSGKTTKQFGKVELDALQSVILSEEKALSNKNTGSSKFDSVRRADLVQLKRLHSKLRR